jgi:cytidyltransferase-like protein
MRIAIFGGTFDPIHSAHLVVAAEAARQFHLDQILFIPNAVPPHKPGRTPYAQRLRMVQVACAGYPQFAVSDIEQANEKSYSILTLERLLPTGGEWFFLIGADFDRMPDFRGVYGMGHRGNPCNLGGLRTRARHPLVQMPARGPAGQHQHRGCGIPVPGTPFARTVR